MSTQALPPTPDPQVNETRAPRPGRAAPRVIAILTASLGVAVLIGGVASSAWPTYAASTTHDEQRQLDVDGVTALDVDAAGTSLTIVFADVSEARLEVRNAETGWTFETDDEVLRVHTPRGAFVSWFRTGNGRAILTLPDELAGVDADLRVGGGALDATGEFGRLGIDLGAGQVNVRGEARTLVADVSAGRGDIDVAGVTSAELSLGAGDMVTRLSGAAPREVTAAVSAGSLTLTLPDEVYDVSTEVTAGDIDNQLRTASDAANSVSVEVSAGNASLLAD